MLRGSDDLNKLKKARLIEYMSAYNLPKGTCEKMRARLLEFSQNQDQWLR